MRCWGWWKMAADYLSVVYNLAEPAAVEAGYERDSRLMIGISIPSGAGVYLSDKVKHRAIVATTGAGKTTTAQAMKEVDFFKKRKVAEIEPALEVKAEGIFQNLPNDDGQMIKVLEEDFGLEPARFKTVAYTPDTEQYREFIEKNPGMEEFFKPIRMSEDELLELLPKITPAGSIERLHIKRAAKFAKQLGMTIRQMIESMTNESAAGFLQNTAAKMEYIAEIGLISYDGVSIKQMLRRKDEISIFTMAFVDDPIDRFLVALVLLIAAYENWKSVHRRKDVLSFFIADAALFAPAKKKDLLDSLERYQLAAKAQLQIYARISRGQGVAWTLDFQTWGDIDDVVKEQIHERFYKKTWSEEVADMLGVTVSTMKRLPVQYAYFDNMHSTRLIKIRPPLSKKARQGEYTPQDFAKAWRRFEKYEDNY